MSTVWTIAEFSDELVTALTNLPAITALDPLPEVRTSMPSLEEGIADYIVIGWTLLTRRKGNVLSEPTATTKKSFSAAWSESSDPGPAKQKPSKPGTGPCSSSP